MLFYHLLPIFILAFAFVWSLLILRRGHHAWHTFAFTALTVLLIFQEVLTLLARAGNPNNTLTYYSATGDLIIALMALSAVYCYHRCMLKSNQEANELIHYKNILNNLSECVCQIDKAGTITYANKTFCKLTGFNCLELKTKQFSDFLNQAHGDFIQSKLFKDCKKFDIIKKSFPIERSDQTPVLYNWTFVPLVDDHHDITEVQISGTLPEPHSSKCSYRERFFRISSELFGIVSKDGYFRSVNPSFEKLLGWPESELLARPYNNFIHPEDKHNAVKSFTYSSSQEGFHLFTNRYLCHNGTYKFIEWSSMQSHDDENLIYAVGRDVTQNHIASEGLKASERQFRTLFESSPDGIFVCSLEGDILDANPVAEKLSKFQLKELKKMHLESLFPKEKKKATLDLDSLASGELHLFESLMKPDEQTSIPLEVNVNRIGYESKVALLFQMRDISERKQVEEALIQTQKEAEAGNRAKSEFLAVMSHEIRTPLNAILGFSQLLYDEVAEEHKTYLERILNGGEHLLSILNDILDYSKMESRKLTLEHREFDPRKLIDGIGKMFSIRAEEKKVQLQINIDEQLPEILISDLQRLKQVIYNLMTNAFKFTNKGTIELAAEVVKTTPKTCTVLFRVKDSGIGIPKEKQAAIFRPFTQVTQDTKRIHEGAGLGLAISQKIVSAMGSKIQCTSVPNKGSDFFFEVKFKVKEEDLFSLAEKSAQASGNDNNAQAPKLKLKTLIAEDDHSSSVLIRNFLKRLGCTVKTVDNGKKAVKAIEQDDYDLVVMDVTMPVMGGIEATETILKRCQGKKAPPHILGITANVLNDYQEQCTEAGMQGFLPKPISFKEFQDYLMNTYTPDTVEK